MVPFAAVAEGQPRDASHSPVFQVMFTLAERAPYAARPLGGDGEMRLLRMTQVQLLVAVHWKSPTCSTRPNADTLVPSVEALWIAEIVMLPRSNCSGARGFNLAA